MDRVEYYSGEPSGSPEIFADPTDTSGQFAINAKDMYQPAYNPYQAYQPYPQQPFMNPPVYNTGYGYNQPMYQQQPYPQRVDQFGRPIMSGVQPTVGAPMNYPTMNNQQQGYQMGIQTIDPSRINTGFVGNPAIALLNQWNQQGTPYQYPNGSYYDPVNQRVVFAPIQQQQVQDKVVTVPGFNPGGSIGMLTSDAQEVCEQMQLDMLYEQEAAAAKRMQRSTGNYNANMYGYANYYGPYMNSYYDNSVYNKYMNKIYEMRDQAIQRRTNFNKKLSRAVHNYLNDGVTDKDIDRIYDGYTYTIPGHSVQEYQNQERLYRLVPYNNAWMYQKHSAEVSKLYHMIAPEGHNMNEFFADAGMFQIMENLEKEYHRRKNTQRYYGEDIYREFIRKYAIEHDMEYKDYKRDNETANKLANLTIEKQGDVTKQDIMNILYPQEKREELSKKGFIINPDGTTEIKPPDSMIFGSAPKVEIHSENEIDYEMRRSAFIASIYDDKRSCAGG